MIKSTDLTANFEKLNKDVGGMYELSIAIAFIIMSCYVLFYYLNDKFWYSSFWKKTLGRLIDGFSID